MALVEKSLPKELFLQLFKGHMQVSDAIRRELLAVKLVLSVPRKDSHPAKGHHLHPVFRPKPKPGRLPAEHDAPDGAPLVLHGKVVVPRGVHLIVGDLPADKEAGQKSVPVQQVLDIAIDLGYAVNTPLDAHVLASCFRARPARMATPRALSVEYCGGANTASVIRSRSSPLEATPPEQSTGRPG